VVVNVTGSTTLTLNVAVALGFAIEVTVTVTVSPADKFVGAVYVADEFVTLLNAPQAEPEHVVLLDCTRLQFTPRFCVSFPTVAVRLTDCPSSSEMVPLGSTCTLTVAPLLWHPAIATMEKMAAINASGNLPRDPARGELTPRCNPIQFGANPAAFRDPFAVRAYVIEVVISPLECF
jgi:hypothetical protein